MAYSPWVIPAPGFQFDLLLNRTDKNSWASPHPTPPPIRHLGALYFGLFEVSVYNSSILEVGALEFGLLKGSVADNASVELSLTLLDLKQLTIPPKDNAKSPINAGALRFSKTNFVKV